MVVGAEVQTSRITLVAESGVPTEVQPLDDNGRNLLKAVMATLEVARRAGLVSYVPVSAERPTAPTMITVEHTLELARMAHRAKQDSPELLSEFNQAFWYARQRLMGVSQADLVVAKCPYSEADIREFIENDFGLFVPQIVSTAPVGLILLGKAFPRMGNLVFQEGTRVFNIDKNNNPIDIHGWMTTERAIDVPSAKTNQAQAEAIVRKAHRIGDTLNVYAVAGQQSKELTGQHLDEVRTSTRILSSRSRGRVLHADFLPDGYWPVGWGLRPGDVRGHLGVRSVEVAKT